MSVLSFNGYEFNGKAIELGELRASNDILTDQEALQARAERDGYIFIRGLIDRSLVMKAREEILYKYAIVGEIDCINHDVMDGVLRDESYIFDINLEALVASLRSGKCYEEVVLNDNLIRLYEKVLGGAVKPFDYRWPRMMRVGEGCGIHADIPYINRGTKNIWTSWIPLGDVPLINGPLMILQNSHQNEKLDSYFNQDAANNRIGWLESDPNKLREKIGGQWLSTNFAAGDVLCFSGYMVHGALDNNSPDRKCRLSSDTRYQLGSDMRDSRWFGDVSNPYGGDYEKGKRVFYPGLLSSSDLNSDLKEEWKPVDGDGRLLRD